MFIVYVERKLQIKIGSLSKKYLTFHRTKKEQNSRSKKIMKGYEMGEVVSDLESRKPKSIKIFRGWIGLD
jgi:hypothetical protein